MESFDLFAMREACNKQQIMICFNGPISKSLIEEIGTALRNYLETDQVTPSAAMDVFSVYIEMTQNIRHYAAQKGYADQNADATVVIARAADGRHVVCAGNIAEQEDGENLLRRVHALAGLDKVQLKAAYKEQLRKPRDSMAATGAGLGLIDIARKASAPLLISLRQLGDGRAFISLQAVI